MKKCCLFCGVEFIALEKEVKRGNGLYCSLSCVAKARNRAKKKKFYEALKDAKPANIDIQPKVGNYIAGLVDGEGSFLIILTRLPTVKLKAGFKVEMSIEEKEILDWLKLVFDSGNTYILPRRNSKTKEAYRFVVQDLHSLITKIIPFFEQYPLQGKKAQDFVRFKTIIYDYIDMMLKGNSEIPLNLIKNLEKINKHYELENIRGINFLDSNYISGLTDGEGTFAVIVTKDIKMKCGFRVKPIFSIQLCEKDKCLLEKIHYVLNCGTVRLDKKRKIADFSVQSINDINKIIIPFFEVHPLRAKKKRDFYLFKEVLKLCSKKEHLTIGGIDKIIKIRKSMNCGGAANRMQWEF